MLLGAWISSGLGQTDPPILKYHPSNMLTQLIKTTVRAGSQRTFVTTAPKMAGVAKQVSANMLFIFWNAEQLE